MSIVFENVLYLSGAPGATTKRTPAQHGADVKNVKDYGAVGDGAAFDDVAIQAAINNGVGPESVTGAVYLPPGDYRIQNTIFLPSAAFQGSFKIYGAGRASRIRMGGSFVGPALYRPSGSGTVTASFTGTVANGSTTLTVSGVSGTISGSNANRLVVPGTNATTGLAADTKIVSGGGTSWQIFPAATRNVGPVPMQSVDDAPNSNGTLFSISDLMFVHDYISNGWGNGIHLKGCVSAVIERCAFSLVYRCIWIDTSNFRVAIRDCDFQGPFSDPLSHGDTQPIAGGAGIIQGILNGDFIFGAGPTDGLMIENCNMQTMSTGIMLGGSYTIIRDVRCEVSTAAIKQIGPDGGGGLAMGFMVDNMNCEECDYGIQAGGINHTHIRRFSVSNDAGISGGVHGASPVAGIQATITNGSIEDCDVRDGPNPFSVAGMSVSGSNLSIKRIQTTTWSLPGAGSGGRAGIFIDPYGDNVGNVMFPWELQVKDLPGITGSVDTTIVNATVGMEYNISDSVSNAIGHVLLSVAADGGGTNHVKVRRNNSAWTICGI